MIPFYIYDTATGRVLGTANYDERGDGAAARAIGLGAIDPLTEYAPAGIKTARPRTLNAIVIDKLTLLANATETVTLSLVPVGTRVSIFKDNERFARAVMTVSDLLLVISFDTPGIYRVLFSQFPNVEQTYIVSAT